jgi:hypothetical protein
VRRTLAAALIVAASNYALRTVVRAIGNIPDTLNSLTWPPIAFASCLGAIGDGAVALLRLALKAPANRIFVFTAYGLMGFWFITPLTLLWTVPMHCPGMS